MHPIVIIPARMASTRLPGKPLADIAGAPMIVQVARRAREADIGPVLIAAAEAEIADAARDAGFEAVLTDPDLPSGSDRVWAAAATVDPDGKYDVLVNVQGDLPTLDSGAVSACLVPLEDPRIDIATVAAPVVTQEERVSPNVVKAVVSIPETKAWGRALYFTRATAPSGEGPLWHHIGLYAFRRAALQRFVSLAPTDIELRERLEQLRALEDGMAIGVARVDTAPFGVDTPADLERARAALG